MYGYLFVHITLHGFFSEFSVVRGRGNDGTVSTGCGSPSVLHPWMLLLHMQETALWIPPVCCVLDDICKRQLLWILRGAFCPLEGGPRHIGTDTWGGPDTLAQTHWHQSYKYNLLQMLTYSLYSEGDESHTAVIIMFTQIKYS